MENKELNMSFPHLIIFSYFCIRKSYPNKQSDADRSNMNGCQIITTKRDNSSNSLDFKEVYSLYRFSENLWNIRRFVAD